MVGKLGLGGLGILVALVSACNEGSGEAFASGSGPFAEGNGESASETVGAGEADSSGNDDDNVDGDSDDDSDDGDMTTFDLGDNAEGSLTFPKTCAEAELSTTSVGCEFYPLALPGTQSVTGFMVSNVSANPATVTLSDKSGVLQQATVQPGATRLLTDDGLHQLFALSAITGDGYVIESDQPLQLFAFMPPTGTETADASIVLPGPTLGTRHRVATYNGTGNETGQYVAVVATQDDTQVSLTLAQPGSRTFAGDGVPELDLDLGNDTLSVTLDRLDTLVVIGWPEPDFNDQINELSGSLVESDKPIAVYSGKELGNVPDEACCADMIATAVPPTTVYGTRYAGVRFLPIGEPSKYDIWRLIGNADGTVVELSGGLQDSIELDAGNIVDIETNEVFWAEGNKAFGLVHFMTAADLLGAPLEAYDCGLLDAPGDPAMGWVYPAGNWLSRYLFSPGTASQSWCHDHVTIVAALTDWESILMDGQPLPEPTPIGGDSGHGYAYVPVPNDSHEIVAPASVGVEVSVYGYVSYGSYFYPGGVGLAPLNPEG